MKISFVLMNDNSKQIGTMLVFSFALFLSPMRSKIDYETSKYKIYPIMEYFPRLGIFIFNNTNVLWKVDLAQSVICWGTKG